ncbi:hypothetical protein [Tenacibaculum caenipelagi]|uniref:Uncharacterized protein n=1 Tax=Tenacibaculum caenipelagi TaxID=1325435 RepID=A0A4R6TAD6_9FLAO|nr:hypothetical protein [Tenacibaculum caenipelagi]TDQ21839.1 hypothetical protein DFQ07_2934 [Tenacibaculum caenipelagi]
MKKEHKTYILVIVVIIVWGIIGVQVFKHFTPKEVELPVANRQIVFNQNEFSKRENYTVKEHNRDPFLGKSLDAPKKQTKRKKVDEPINFPSIIYNGMIQSGKNQSYIISINGNQNIQKIGQTINSVKLLSGSKKEIKVSYKGNSKKVTLN